MRKVHVIFDHPSYDKSVAIKLTKKTMGEKLSQVLKDSSSMNNPDSLLPVRSTTAIDEENTNVVAISENTSAGMSAEPSIAPLEIAETITTDIEPEIINLINNPEPIPSTSKSGDNVDEPSIEETPTTSKPARTSKEGPIPSTSTRKRTASSDTRSEKNRRTQAAGGKGGKCKGEGKGKCKRKGTGKGKGKRSEKETKEDDNTEQACGICIKFYKEGEEWIMCDGCSVWYHKDCVGLDDSE